MFYIIPIHVIPIFYGLGANFVYMDVLGEEPQAKAVNSCFDYQLERHGNSSDRLPAYQNTVLSA